MTFFRFSLVLTLAIWAFSITMWLMPEADRWERGLNDYYTATFLELPFFCLILVVVLVFKRNTCPSKGLLKATMISCWSYVFFPVLTSVLLIVVTFLGITGY